MIDWFTVTLSLLPDDPWATAPRIIAHLSVARVQTLGRNLAVAGALERARQRGFHRGLWLAGVASAVETEPWTPNTDGKAAP